MLNDFHNYELFVVDTDAYSGGIERGMTGYCTGEIEGHSTSTEESVESFNKVAPDNVKEYMKRNVCHAFQHESCSDWNGPCDIWITPGYWNDGLGSHWPDSKWGSREAEEAYNKSAKEFKQDFSIEKHPAYQSVAIAFSKDTISYNKEMRNFIMSRAKEYIDSLDKRYDSNKIISFRVIQIIETPTWTLLE